MDSLGSMVTKIVAMSLVFLAPIKAAMTATSVLVILDLISGIWAAKKEGQPITSQGIRRTITKTFVYQGAIVFAFIMEKYLIQELPVLKVVTSLIALSEGKSFFENAYRITGINLFRTILDKLHGTKK